MYYRPKTVKWKWWGWRSWCVAFLTELSFLFYFCWLINDLKQYKTDGEQAILYQVIDHHLPRDKSVVYESPRFEELFGPLARRHERLESALDINTIWNAGKQIFLGKAFMFKLKVNTIDSTRLCISIYFKRSTCGRYHGRVIELKKTERADDAK